MLRGRLHRKMVAVFALAAVAFTASGVPDNKGIDAAIGWFGFLALAVVFLVLVGLAITRAVRGRSRAAAARSPGARNTRSRQVHKERNGV